MNDATRTTKRCTWVTVDASVAVLTGRVRTTHRTAKAARLEAARATARGEKREAVSAQCAALMQAGRNWVEAVQMLAGVEVAPVAVEVTP